ncbi:oxygen-insensitive NADPH nitroreductase [Lonepinella sp. BR2474]|uniref:oxygen-insensitive NADPH nitroreductase n=1 Tax=Lonepinella sp. BR2474 TaxID=3434548 RepID=UPI003F6DD05C
MQSQSALATALHHRSIRRFTDQAIPTEVFEQLIEAGQMASSSSFLQSVSIIRVTDSIKRQQIRTICGGGSETGQMYVQESPEFLVFCIDTYRHQQLVPEAQTDWMEMLLIGAVDVGIMAQNVLLCAESVGLGGVYIGSLRNGIAQVADILGLPTGVVPLVGLCLGYPDQTPLQRPRLPTHVILSENHYQAASQRDLAEYDEQVRAYYVQRSSKALNWTEQVRNTLAKPIRPEILPFLHKQGLAKR